MESIHLQLLVKPPWRNAQGIARIQETLASLGLEVSGAGGATVSARSSDEIAFRRVFGKSLPSIDPPRPNRFRACAASRAGRGCQRRRRTATWRTRTNVGGSNEAIRSQDPDRSSRGDRASEELGSRCVSTAARRSRPDEAGCAAVGAKRRPPDLLDMDRAPFEMHRRGFETRFAAAAASRGTRGNSSCLNEAERFTMDRNQASQFQAFTFPRRVRESRPGVTS
jgi:hypothetical protein